MRFPAARASPFGIHRVAVRSGAVGLALASFVFGCGGEAAAPAPRAPSWSAPAGEPAPRDAGMDEGGADRGTAATLTLDVLVTRGPWLAPGMKEATRFETRDDRSVRREIARAADRDVCVRIAFAAATAVHVWLEDARGDPLADGGTAESGALGARGPVCVRRGDAIVLRAESDAPTSLRVVAWRSP